jgi:hypothetical protein
MKISVWLSQLNPQSRTIAAAEAYVRAVSQPTREPGERRVAPARRDCGWAKRRPRLAVRICPLLELFPQESIEIRLDLGGHFARQFHQAIEYALQLRDARRSGHSVAADHPNFPWIACHPRCGAVETCGSCAADPITIVAWLTFGWMICR